MLARELREEGVGCCFPCLSDPGMEVPQHRGSLAPWAFSWRAVALENPLDSQQTVLDAKQTFIVLRHFDTELICYRSITQPC